jgi:hemolysin III
MGWVCVAVFGKLTSAMSAISFGFLLAGGIIYTIGGVIYAIKIPALDDKKKFFGTHEIFHLFVMGGSICHFVCMFNITK